MDVEGFLNIERRTGIKDSDIKGFLSKVDNVQDQLAKLMSGELAPEDVRIPGERTPEEEGKQTLETLCLVCTTPTHPSISLFPSFLLPPPSFLCSSVACSFMAPPVSLKN